MKKFGYACGVAVGLMIGTAQAQEATFADALTKGKVTLDMRARYEHVDQTGLAKNAVALTLRTRLGYETAEYYKFKALVEFQDVRNLANDAYNSTFNGRTRSPVVGDGNGATLSRAQLSYTGVPGTTIVAGRQRLLINNQRFVGNAGFRQREQTFDAVRVTNKSIANLELDYAYIGEVQRVFGPKVATGKLPSDSHSFNVVYTGIANVSVAAYGLLLDLGPLSVLNTKTFGGRIVGERPLVGWTLLTFAGEFAKQTDYKDNPRQIDVNYYLGEAGLKYKQASGSVGYEVLEGDGLTGFATPLATLFAFNGWADAFLTTPTRGVEDLYFKAGYIFNDVPMLNRISVQVIYHDYKPNTGAGTYGHEWNALVSVPLNPRWTFEARYADYSTGTIAGVPSRSKLWFSVNLKI